MIRCYLLLGGILLAAALYAAPAGNTPLRTLWLGSSSLYYHDQPKLLAAWLTQYAGMPATAALAGRSGTGVHVYLRPEFQPEYGLARGQTVLQKIAAERFDYVVLQVPAEFINGPEGEEHDRSLDVYCKAIREAGGRPVFYEMGWGRDEKAEVGRQKILTAAIRNHVDLFAPCSTAWARVRRERPDLALQNPPDTAHPGTLGCYLNLCCFYAAFAGKPPDGVPTTIPIWPHLDADGKLAAGEKVKSAQFDDYDAALPGWMKRLVVSAAETRIADDTASYLRCVAWEEYQAASKRLREGIAPRPLPGVP